MECPVCYDELIDSVYCVFECRHHLCVNCKVGIKNCSLCRNEIKSIILRGGYQCIIKVDNKLCTLEIGKKDNIYGFI